MLEMKISITAADLSAAINNLSASIAAAFAVKLTDHAQQLQSDANIERTPNTLPSVAPVTPVVPVAAPAAPVVPTSAPGYTLEMIAAAGSSLIDAGKLDALMALLGKYGVDNLTNIAPEHYAAIAMELRALGARL